MTVDPSAATCTAPRCAHGGAAEIQWSALSDVLASMLHAHKLMQVMMAVVPRVVVAVPKVVVIVAVTAPDGVASVMWRVSMCVRAMDCRLLLAERYCRVANGVAAADVHVVVPRAEDVPLRAKSRVEAAAAGLATRGESKACDSFVVPPREAERAPSLECVRHQGRAAPVSIVDVAVVAVVAGCVRTQPQVRHRLLHTEAQGVALWRISQERAPRVAPVGRHG